MLVLQLFVVEDLDIGVEGFRAISALPDLRSLTLTSCDGIDRSGLEMLCGMSNLQYLDMSDVWEFAGDTLQPLASLTNLQVFTPCGHHGLCTTFRRCFARTEYLNIHLP
jgi:hypothetical protein